MRLDGAGPVLAGALVVVATAILLATLWDRTGIALRVVCATACVLSVLATSALQLNRMTETYPTWAGLAGADGPASSSRGSAVAAPRTPFLIGGAPGRSGRGTIVTLTIAGAAAGMTMPAFVYLPAAYDTPAGRRERFPVIEAAHGYPGSPKTWLHRLNVQSYLDAQMAVGRMAPTVVVFPYQTPRALLDTECTDLAHGPHAETYLTADVPALIKARFRVRQDRAGWGLIGYSAGGFCATDLALRHPGEYAAAASLSGYADPGIAVGDGSEKTTNNAAWRLRHLPHPALALYLAYAADDRHSSRDNLLLARLARRPLAVTTAVVAHGGHSDAVWEAMEGPAFDWLSARLARPVSP
jgi:enterochelin esterase-like enzyme